MFYMLLFLKFQKQLSRDVLIKRCSENMHKFTREHPCRKVISIKLLCYFIEIALWHECSPVNLLHIFRAPFPKNTSGRLPLKFPKIFKKEAIWPGKSIEIYMDFTGNFLMFSWQLFFRTTSCLTKSSGFINYPSKVVDSFL